MSSTMLGSSESVVVESAFETITAPTAVDPIGPGLHSAVCCAKKTLKLREFGATHDSALKTEVHRMWPKDLRLAEGVGARSLCGRGHWSECEDHACGQLDDSHHCPSTRIISTSFLKQGHSDLGGRKAGLWHRRNE